MPETPSQQYAARLDAHLETLPSDIARRNFLAGQNARWVRLYAEFQRDAANGCAPLDIRAVDHVEIISDIGRRLAKLQEVAHA